MVTLSQLVQWTVTKELLKKKLRRVVVTLICAGIKSAARTGVVWAGRVTRLNVDKLLSVGQPDEVLRFMWALFTLGQRVSDNS